MTEEQRKSSLFMVKWPLAALLLGLTAAGLFLGGAYLYLEYERKADRTSRRALQDAQARLANANKEVEDLRASVDTYRQLLSNGLIGTENRLDWIEGVARLGSKYRLSTLEYDMAPQRTVPLSGGRSFPSIDINGSRVRLKFQALHEGDMLGFIDELTTMPKGTFPFERCTFKMLPSVPSEPLAPRVDGDCVLDWITLRDKNARKDGANPAGIAAPDAKGPAK